MRSRLNKNNPDKLFDAQADEIKSRARESARVPSLRIGGRNQDGTQRTALSFEVTGEPMNVSEEPTVAFVDWEQIAGVLGFNRRERWVWLRCWRDGEHYRQCGLTSHEFGAIQREITRSIKERLEEVRPHLGYLAESEAFLTKNVLTTGQNRPGLGTRDRKGLFVNLDKLQDQLAGAKKKLQTLEARGHAADLAAGTARAALGSAQAAQKMEAVDAVLEGKPIGTIAKKIAAAQAEVEAREGEHVAVIGAIDRQVEIIREIEGEIQAVRVEACLDVVNPIYREFVALQRKADELARKIDEERMKHAVDPYNFAGQLLKPRNQDDSLADFPQRNVAAQTLNAAMARGWMATPGAALTIAV